jgi:hypothetical protein
VTAPGAKAASPAASRSARQGQVPRKRSPKPKIRLPRGWLYVGSELGQPEYQLKAVWDADVKKGKLWCTEHTVDVLLISTEATTELIDMIAEAVGSPSKVVMRDISEWAAKVVLPEAVRPRKRNGEVGIKVLAQAVSDLAVELATARGLTEYDKAMYARRYGKLRDDFAVLREKFTEAEGGFEIVQVQISSLLEEE